MFKISWGHLSLKEDIKLNRSLRSPLGPLNSFGQIYLLCFYAHAILDSNSPLYCFGFFLVVVISSYNIPIFLLLLLFQSRKQVLCATKWEQQRRSVIKG